MQRFDSKLRVWGFGIRASAGSGLRAKATEGFRACRVKDRSQNLELRL